MNPRPPNLAARAALHLVRGPWLAAWLAAGLATWLGGLHASSQHHNGLFSGAVPGARLVFPRKIQDGDSDVLEHRHGQNHRHHRARRLATPLPARQTEAGLSHDEPAVQYEVALDDAAPVRLLLWPSTAFLAPGLRVDRQPRAAEARARRPRVGPASCHYRGVVQGDRRSSVALSACGPGLVGLVQTSRADYWLEPASGATTANATSGTQPHVVFQRRRGRGHARRHGHHRARARRRRLWRRRRRHAKDCGTRDPPTRRRNATNGTLPRLRVRRPRSVSREKNVEVLLVADPSMTTFHQDGDIETYLLTIMNMVAALYHDPTIGNLINVMVVRIIVMDEWAAQTQTEEKPFNVTVNADKTLTSFCRWASQINPADEADPHHHDVAVLVTRVDICARRDTPCSTLGVAHVGGMCSPDRSCSVSQDNGIVLAHTIAHEMGHNFGMTHDTGTSGCSRKAEGVLHVMTSTFEADNHRMAWSACSRSSITAFLDDDKKNCLDDAPSLGGYQYPDLPAGSMYDAEYQCRLQFGAEEAGLCSDIEEVCSRLWCEVDGQCTTLLQPAAPGTVCGRHKWCHDQQCSEMVESPQPVPGGWSAWGDWGACSRTCGAGVSIMERHCDHPSPQHGGAYCLGERRRYRVCNTQACPKGAPSFRAVQCMAFNNSSYHGSLHTWLPYFDTDEPCELFCSDSEDSVIAPWGAAADGTPCNVGRRDMCIGRVCRRVGCDWTVDSDAVEDRCGVCHGDGSQCDTVTGTFARPEGHGYVEAFYVPAGARNVVIEEELASKNFLAIGSANKPVFYLNGRRKIALPGEYDVGGAAALYERAGERESVRIPGPLSDTVLVYVLFRGARSPGVRYEYTVRRARPRSSAALPRWRWPDWPACSATCGGGLQQRRAVCASEREAPETGVLDEALHLDDNECELTDGPRPPAQNRTCASHACPATWWPGPWQVCSATCGSGAVHRRSVLCVVPGVPGQIAMALPDEECDPGARPAEQERCEGVPACPLAPSDAAGPPGPVLNDTSIGGPLANSTGGNGLPAMPTRPHDDVLELDGGEAVDLDRLAEDERNFLVNYTTFLQGSLAILTSTPVPAQRTGQGVWEDDADLEPLQRRHPRPGRQRKGPRERKKSLLTTSKKPEARQTENGKRHAVPLG